MTFVHKIISYIQAETNSNLSSITISYPRLERKELRVLSAEEQQNLIQYLVQDFDIYKFSVLIALFTGLRIGEVCALQWKDISVESGLLTVRHTVQRIKIQIVILQKTLLQLGTPKLFFRKNAACYKWTAKTVQTIST